jgi:hypothetical protein
MRATSFPEFVEKHPSNYSPRLARGFSLFPAYEKSQHEKTWWLISILPLILHAFAVGVSFVM